MQPHANTVPGLHPHSAAIILAVQQRNPRIGILVWSARSRESERFTSHLKAFNKAVLDLCDSNLIAGNRFRDVFVTEFFAKTETTSLLLAMLETALYFVDEVHRGRREPAMFYFRHLSRIGRTTDVVSEMIPIRDERDSLVEFLVLETPMTNDSCIVTRSPDGLAPQEPTETRAVRRWTDHSTDFERTSTRSAASSDVSRCKECNSQEISWRGYVFGVCFRHKDLRRLRIGERTVVHPQACAIGVDFEDCGRSDSST